MVKFVAAAALAILFVAALPRVHESLPEGRLKSIVQLPGMAVSRMEIGGADPLTLLVAGLVVVLLLVGIYTLFARS